MSLRTLWGVLGENQIFIDMDAGNLADLRHRTLALGSAVVFNPIDVSSWGDRCRRGAPGRM